MDKQQRNMIESTPDAGVVSLIESLSMLRSLVTPDAVALDEEEICRHAVDVFVQHRDIEFSAIFLLRRGRLECVARAYRPAESAGEPLGKPFSEDFLKAIAQSAIDMGRVATMTDLREIEPRTSGSLIAAPVSSRQRVQGASVLWHSRARRYAPWHQRLLVLCCDILMQMLLNGRLAIGQKQAITRYTRELSRINTRLDSEKQLRSAAEGAFRAQSRKHLQQAKRDPLTGLLNRPGFVRELEAAIARAGAEGEEYGLLYADIDRFRIINDAGGQVAGDHLIQALAELIRRQFDEGVGLARLGSDEFGILIHNHAADTAFKKAEALRRSVESLEFSHRGQRFVFSISIGVVTFSGHCPGVEELMRRACSACFEAQDHGGGRVRVFKESDGRMQRREREVHSLSLLTRGLEQNRLELWCQPMVPIGRYGGAEAKPRSNYEILVRLRDGEGEIMAPGQFLPIAERFGLSVKLDRWVVDAALNILEEHVGRLDEFGHISINLSGHSIGNRGFLEYIMERLQGASIPPHKICFEVTETVAISDLAAARQFIVALKEMGSQFSLDDFGSGHASYLYLRDLPVDYLKIDGEFVREIASDSVSHSLVRSINDIAQIVGKKTIAEYVENDTTLKLLQEIGVDFAQGYFVGRPGDLRKTLRSTGR